MKETKTINFDEKVAATCIALRGLRQHSAHCRHFFFSFQAKDKPDGGAEGDIFDKGRI